MKKFIKSTLILLLAAITLMMSSCSISDVKDERTEDRTREDNITSADNGWLESPDTSSPESSQKPHETQEPATTEEATTRAPETEAPSFIFSTYNNGYSVTGYEGTDKKITIPEYYEGKPVLAIAENAFKNSKITSVSIPSTVTYIGDYAFAGSNLSSITIPENVSYIGKGVFYDCSLMSSVQYNAIDCESGWMYSANPWQSPTVEPIFEYCYITNIEIGSSVKTIPAYLFTSCSSVKTITIPESIEVINYGAFLDCTKLNTVNYNAIKAKAVCQTKSSQGYPFSIAIFDNCNSLTTINFGSKVQSIEGGMFANCTKLKSINIPDNVKYVSQCLFESCTSLEKIVLGTGIEELGYQPYYYSNSSYYAEHALLGAQNIQTAELKGVKSIDENVLQYNPNITTLILGSVETISAEAFKNCKSLEKISIPETILSIGDKAFDGCKLIEYNTYENGNYYGNDTNPYVYYCGPIKEASSYTLHPSTKCIGYKAFYNQKKLKSITIPEGMRSIGESAFQECTSLTEITLPDGICHIGEASFKNCTSLKSVKLPVGITSIYTDTFYSTAITSIDLPYGLEIIESCAFERCEKLTHVSVPETVKHIDNNAFYYVYSIKQVDITSLAAWCQMEECGIIFGNYSTSKKYNLYLNGELVTNLTIPKGVTKIGDSVFQGVQSITEVTIPKSVTTIDYSAFTGCINLTKINFEGTKAEWNRIEKLSGYLSWDDYTGEYIIYCTDGRIAK